MTIFGTLKRNPTTDEQLAKQQAEQVRTARLETARRGDNFTEIPRERLISRGPGKFSWLVDAETDLVWALAPGIVFMPGSITLIATHAPVIVLAGWPDDQAAEFADGVFELAAGVAFVADDRLSAVECPREEWQRDFAFGTVGRDERGGPGCAVGGAEQVQSQPPEPAGVALAVAVTANIGEVGAAARLERAAALDRGRVEQHEIVVGAGALSRHDAAQPLNLVAQPLPSLVEGVLLRSEGAGSAVSNLEAPSRLTGTGHRPQLVIESACRGRLHLCGSCVWLFWDC